MKKNTLLILLLFIFVQVQGQAIDTTRIDKIIKMESMIDSMTALIRKLDNDIQRLKQNMVEGTSDLDQLLALLNENEIENINTDSRSRRKRVDALLKAITQRPGQLRFNGDMTSIIQSVRSDDSLFYVATGSFDIFAHTSFGNNTLLFIDLEAIGGNGPDAFSPTFSPLNGDAGSTQDSDGIDRIHVLEAWVEFTLWKNKIIVTAGKIDLTNYFDVNAVANDETMQFITGAFINSSALAVPSNSPGIRLKSTFFNRLHIQLAFSNYFNSGSDIFSHIFRIGGIGYTFLLESPFEANLRFYSYYHPLAHARGFGLTVDKKILNKYNIFLRYGNNDPKIAKQWGVQKAYSFGCSYIKSVFSRQMTLGVAYGKSVSHEQFLLKNEQTMEFFARMQFNKWTYFTPHVQWVRNAGGSDQDLLIFSVRTHFNF